MDLNQQGGFQERDSVRNTITFNPLYRVQQGIILLAGACLLCLPAFYNGYPLIFPDLLDYVGDGMAIVRRHWPAGVHPPFYGVAIWPLHLETSLWPIVIIQGLVICYLLSVVLRAIGAALRGPVFLALIAGLAIFTSLPWYVSHVMPDVFGGVLILSLFLLAFCTERLTLFEKVYFSLLAVSSFLFHLSFLPVGIGILALAIGFRLLHRRSNNVQPVFALIPILLSLGLSSYVSYRLWGNLSGPPSTPPYLLAHVLVDGPGKKFLLQVCGQQKYVLCKYQDSIPDDVNDFMFHKNSPFQSSGEQHQIRAEAREIIVGTMEMFPFETIKVAVKAGITQVMTFDTEVAELNYIPDGKGNMFPDTFDAKLPFIGRSYRHSKQHEEVLSRANLEWMNDIHRLVVMLSALFCVYALARCVKIGDWICVQFLTIICASILINGLVTGMIVGVFGRFGARVIWLLPFAAVAVALSMWYAAHRPSSPAPPV